MEKRMSKKSRRQATDMFTVSYSQGWFHITYPVAYGHDTTYESICEDSELQALRERLVIERFVAAVRDAIQMELLCNGRH